MIKYLLTNFIVFLLIFLNISNSQNATEILLYADDISYDKEENLIGKGKAKILYDNQIISSDLIIYQKKNKKIILPIKFSLKDELNNYYYGTSGQFSKDLKYATINDPKILLNDGSRIVGKTAKRDGAIDIITKGVYSPCTSKIKIGSFICPVWQLEGEKILHDYDNLFLYQKHAKMRILTVPALYSPYLVTPSPLRKERKSGFLSPSISLNFLDTKTSQTISFPYYFNISIDKELTLTPTIKYGGGTDSSQRFIFDYRQLISGGNLNTNLTFDSTFEKGNSNKWLKEGSLVTSYSKNLNEHFRIGLSSALQTSKNYIQKTIPNDDLSYSSSLSTSLNVVGYNLNKFDAKLDIRTTTYHVAQNNENNKTTPTILPAINYYTGNEELKKFNYNSTFDFYNIFRDTGTDIHSQRQIKFSNTLKLNRNFIQYGTNINLSSDIFNQLYWTENKKISNKYHSGNYYRIFPIFGLNLQTPFRINNGLLDLVYTPKISFILAPGSSNSNKISNEDSSNNSYTINNNSSLNRYSGSDKLDNSKRVSMEFQVNNKELDARLSQTYEFTNNSNFHYGQGNERKLSDLLGVFSLNKNIFRANYEFRYDQYEEFVKSQKLDFNTSNKFGSIGISYLDQKSKTDKIIVTDKETVNYSYGSVKIKKYSKISINGLYDLKKDINTENSFVYKYFDECFGITLNFNRKSYSEDNLKPQDYLTLMFSFKNVGSYASTNLAVSETDKQDIQWEGSSVKDELFY